MDLLCLHNEHCQTESDTQCLKDSPKLRESQDQIGVDSVVPATTSLSPYFEFKNFKLFLNQPMEAKNWDSEHNMAHNKSHASQLCKVICHSTFKKKMKIT